MRNTNKRSAGYKTRAERKREKKKRTKKEYLKWKKSF